MFTIYSIADSCYIQDNKTGEFMSGLDNLKAEIKAQAKKIGRQTTHAVGKELREGKRALADLMEPPSTLTQIERFFEDIWKDEIKPAAAKLNAGVRRQMNTLYKGISDLIKSDKTLGVIADSISDFAKKISKAVSPVMKKLGNFCSKLGALVKSLAGTSKDREKAWKNMKKATKEVGTAIKQAVVGKNKTSFTR